LQGALIFVVVDVEQRLLQPGVQQLLQLLIVHL